MWPYYQQCPLSHAFSSCFRRLVFQMVLGIVHISISTKIFLQWVSKINIILWIVLKDILTPAQAATRKDAWTGAGKRRGAGVEEGAGVRAETEATSWLPLLNSQQIHVTQYVLYCIPEFEPPRICQRSCSRCPQQSSVTCLYLYYSFQILGVAANSTFKGDKVLDQKRRVQQIWKEGRIEACIHWPCRHRFSSSLAFEIQEVLGCMYFVFIWSNNFRFRAVGVLWHWDFTLRVKKDIEEAMPQDLNPTYTVCCKDLFMRVIPNKGLLRARTRSEETLGEHLRFYLRYARIGASRFNSSACWITMMLWPSPQSSRYFKLRWLPHSRRTAVRKVCSTRMKGLSISNERWSV